MKDTPDFLAKLRQIKVRESTLLITLDVESMYTNINNTEGLEAVKTAFAENPDVRRPDNEILEWLRLSLECNDFQFNGETFLQVSGTAMGKKWAPAYANLFMAQWEKEVFDKCAIWPYFYKRFLDDLFMLWDYGLEAFLEFFEILNSHNPAVKLTHRIEVLSNDYLDLTIFKGPDFEKHFKLDTKTFFKPVDTHQLLHKSSFHPKHTFAGILKSQILRFFRNSTQISDFDEACSVLFAALKKRGFSKRFLRKMKSETLAGIRNSNLIPPHSNHLDNEDHFASPCGYIQCFTCQYVHPCSSVTSNVTKEVFKLQHDLTCSSPRLIYLIECEICGIQYIGQTKRSLRHRFNNHRYDLENYENRPTTVSLHFNQGSCHCVYEQDLTIIPIFQGPNLETPELTSQALSEIEDYFMKKMKTYAPYGLNIAIRKQKDAPAVHFIVPYSATAARAAKIVKRHYLKLQECMPLDFDLPLLTAYSRNKNLKDTLVSAKIK